MKIDLKLKPSAVGQYFVMQCDKYLLYESVPKETSARYGWEVNEFRQNATTEAGYHWEEILCDRLRADETVELIDLKKVGRDVTFEETLDALRNLSCKDKTIYIYQALFVVTPTFQREHFSSEDGALTHVTMSSHMFPDFIKAEYVASKNKYRLTIIDAKNASRLKMNAEIQIALYVEVLRAILKDEGIDNCFVNDEVGVVWNREKITDECLIHEFPLADALATLDEFFGTKIPSIREVIDSSEDTSEVQDGLCYHISQKCEYCANFDRCKKYCIERKSARLLPYITQEAQNRLEELVETGVLADDSFASVKELLLSNPEVLTDDCSFWKNIKNNLDAYEKGLLAFFNGEKTYFDKIGTSISMPKGQNFALYLTAQQDADSGRNYAFAWLLKTSYGIDLFGEGLNENGFARITENKDEAFGRGTYFDAIVAENNSREEFDRIERLFVEKIYDILNRIHECSCERKQLQFFVMDDYERNNIENMLFDMLETLDSEENQELLEKVMAILFWTQGERMVTDSSYEPERMVENPITVITSEIGRLYVLSAGISYNLQKIASIFSPTFNFDDEKGFYFGKLSNTIDPTNIVRIWENKDAEESKLHLSYLSSHLRKRLFVEDIIVRAIQKNNSKLSQWPSKYELQKPKYPDYPEIARLDFENRYEEILSYKQIRGVRINGIQNAIDNGSILLLEYTGEGDTYNVLNSENYCGNEWFTSWLCEDTSANRMQLMMLQDTRFTMHPKLKFSAEYAIGEHTVFYPADFSQSENFNYRDTCGEATVDFKAKSKEFKPIVGKKYLFFEVYSDFNSNKTAAGIAKLINRQELLEPTAISLDTDLVFDDTARTICSKYWSPDGYTFSPSQEKAFIHLFERKLNVLVGPPASGKTDFIARALITLACYYKETQNRNLKIMVTAMSNSAIENVLLKLDKMLSTSNPYAIQVYKSSRFDDKKAFAEKRVQLINDKKVNAEMNQDIIQIIGMTSWSAFKEFHDGGMRHFDMIVMDEASQVRAMDSFINLECSNDKTRFLLVGDDDQLPPIIGGKYKQVEGQKYIHGSVFRMFLTGLGKGHADIIPLSDNFRMNGILCKYSANMIYGDQYKAFNDQIRTQKIKLRATSKDEFLSFVLDEEYPLVFCELFGLSRSQTEAEVDLVTKIVRELWNNLLNPENGRLASENDCFWRDGEVGGQLIEGACGIITPHHEHINRLKTSISEELGLDRKDLFIGTVDKLQGKERRAVIVSYGVSESEKIRNEAEFIFSRNRLNVSLTRGKAKTIVFLSDAIAESNMATNILMSNNPELKEGIDYVHGFAEFMRCADAKEDIAYMDYECGDVTLRIWKKRLIEG